MTYFRHRHHSHPLRLPSDRFTSILCEFSHKKLDFYQGVTPGCMYVCMWIYIAQPLQPKQSRGAVSPGRPPPAQSLLVTPLYTFSFCIVQTVKAVGSKRSEVASVLSDTNFFDTLCYSSCDSTMMLRRR